MNDARLVFFEHQVFPIASMTVSLALTDIDDKSPTEITKERMIFMCQFLRLGAEFGCLSLVEEE